MKLVAAAALAAAFCAGAFAGDIIVLTDGRTLGSPHPSDPPSAADFASSNVAVTDETMDGVVYRLTGVPTKQTAARAQVKAVLHDPATVPADLTNGLALIAGGQFDDGRAKLVAVARNAALPAWVQAEAAFRHAEAYATEGNAGAAERALAAFALERSRSRHALGAKRLRARLLLDLGREEDAKAEYESAAHVTGATDDEVLAARFLAAWAGARPALRSGDAAALAATAKTFDELRPRGAAQGALAARCQVAKAACDGATDALAAVVAGSEDAFVLAVGHTLLADAARRRAGAAKDRSLLEDAQERYLRVVLLYRDAEGAADFVAAAQFHAGEVFLLLAREDSDADAKTGARREWEDLVRRAPRSEWARKARAALAAL